MIILLTAVHYHYAGFALPLIAGQAGDYLTNGEWYGNSVTGVVARVTTLAIIVNIGVIAVGITLSPIVEIIAVSVFTVAVALFCVSVFGVIIRRVTFVPRVLFAVAAVSIVFSMGLAVLYGFSQYDRVAEFVTIGEMVRWHGVLNAFGFVLPSFLAFELLPRG